jgi:hypothetical protein
MILKSGCDHTFALAPPNTLGAAKIVGEGKALSRHGG